jgi:RHS repeat-associated protein/uncharacterized repeat protein (TIGR01451 family)
MQLTKWFRDWSFRKRVSTHKRRRKAERKSLFRKLELESLEGRILPATVNWINPNGGNWDTAANWSTGSLPGVGDDVVVRTALAATITIQSGDMVSVHSLTTGGNDTLSITGGSLSVAAKSTLNGALAMTGGSLTASGPGGTLTANRSTTVSAASLYATGGASLNLSKLTSYDSPGTYENETWQATGTGSTLNLAGLTGLGTVSSWSSLQVEALQGGHVNLSALASIGNSSYYLGFYADAGGSLIDLSALTSFDSPGGSLKLTNGATIRDGQLTSLNGVSITRDGTGTLATSQWALLTNSTLTVTAGSYTLAGVTDLDGSSLYVQGGASLALPGVTSFASPDTYGYATWQTTRAGSTLTLSGLTGLGTVSSWGNLQVQALQGGRVNLSALVSIGSASQYVGFAADASGSLIDLSALTSFDSPGGSLKVTNGAAIRDGQLTSLNGVSITRDGTGTLLTSQWTSLTDDALTVTGGSYTLAGVTDLDGSSLYVQGGASLALPGVASYANQITYDNAMWQATGAGSTLSLGGLTGLGTISTWASLHVQALQGGHVNLPDLASIGNSSLNVQIAADGSGSVIDLPTLTSYATPGGSLAASNDGSIAIGKDVVTMPETGNGATINVPQLPQGFQGVTIFLASSGTFTGGTTFNVPQGETIGITGVTITGGTTFNVAQGTVVNLTGGTYSGTFAGSGGGTVQIPSGWVAIGLGGLTTNFAGSMFQWTGGVICSALGNLTNLGTINLAGCSDKGFYSDGTFDNFGTIIQTGTGSLGLHSDGVTATTLNIEAGGSYLIESDSGIDNPWGGIVAVINAGKIAKTAGTGTSNLLINGRLTNTGTIEADSGTLALAPVSFGQVSGGTLSGGTWNALNGAQLAFPSGTTITSNAANVSLDGVGAAIAGLGGLAANSGSFTITQGAGFTTAGDFNNIGSLTIGTGSTLKVAGNFTQAAGGTLNDQIGGTPASGFFGQVTVANTATLGGAFNLALVNGFSPSAGQAFAPITFANAAGSLPTFTGLSPFFTEWLSASSLNLVDLTNGVDLVLNNVTAPTTGTAGQVITVSWQVTNQGTSAAGGSWQDSVYLSNTPSTSAGSILLGTLQRSGGLNAGGSYSSSLTATVPTLGPGYYYVLVQVDSLNQVADQNPANNTMAATSGELSVSLPTLTLGTPYSDAFTAAGQEQYYQVTVLAGGALQVALTSAASSGATALYISQGALPTPNNYQQAVIVANQPNQILTVPQVTVGGIYYILAQGVSGAAATAGYTLTVTQGNTLAVSAISSYAGGNAGNVTVEIDGANLTPTTTASLTLGSTIINTSAIDFVNASQVYATFNLAGAAAGNYTLAVQQGSQSATAATPFQVAAASSAPLSVVLSVPQYIRSGRTGTIVISYTNPTNNDMVAPLLTVSSTNTSVFLSTPDDPNNYTQSAQVLAVAPSGPAGILRPGQSGSLTLTLLSNDTTNGDQIPVQVDQIQAGQSIDWASQQASLQPITFSTAAWNVIFNNLLAALGTTTDSYNAALAQAATYLGGLGETTAQVSNVDRLWSFLISQANASYPTATLSSAVDAGLSTPGSLSLAIDRTFVSSIAGRYQPGIFGLGWSTSWQTTLTVATSGNVTINSGGTIGHFVLQANGSYLDTAGEYGTLSSPGGVFTFTTTSGTQYVFRTGGQLNYVQDTNGNRIALGYNTQNQLVTLTYSNPSYSSEPSEELKLTYNTQGLVSQVADGTGAKWSYNYDTAGHLLSVTAPGKLTTSYSYDTGGNAETANALLSITNPDGSQQKITYDGQGRLVSSSGNGGADPIAYAYPGEAEVTATDAAGHQVAAWFNDLGLASRVEDPRGALASFQYDTNGNLVGYTDAAGNTYQGTYDQNGNLTQIVNPLGQAVHMTFGSLGNLTSMTDAAGNTTHYSYDPAGNLLNITYPESTQQSFSYDPLGNLSQTVEQNRHAIGYQENAQGLVTQQTFADGSKQFFAYDPHGNLTSAQTYDATGTLTGTTCLRYNAGNELLSIGYPNGLSLKFTYDPKGQRTQSVDQSGFTVNYSYDSLGRLSKLTDGSGNLIVQYTYNNVGQLVKKLNGNGTYTAYGFDAAGNLTSEVNYAPNQTVNSSFSYMYNLLGQVTSVTDAAHNVTHYGYDATGQLTQVVLPGGQTITYVYNAAGDRTEVINNDTVTSYASNVMNEIMQVGSASLHYDANGNLHTVTDSTGTTQYQFNDLNHLVSITAPDGTVTSFQYSPLGYLVGTNVGGTQTSYLVDPTGLGNVVGSYNGSGSLIAHYIYGLGLVSQTEPSGTGYYDFDASGNTVGITGASGSYINQYKYLPFGETTTVSETLPNSFTFLGQFGAMQIGNNLFYMRARDYTPATGQFLSNDPFGLGVGDPNMRRYENNDPTNRMDVRALQSYLGPQQPGALFEQGDSGQGYPCSEGRSCECGGNSSTGGASAASGSPSGFGGIGGASEESRRYHGPSGNGFKDAANALDDVVNMAKVDGHQVGSGTGTSQLSEDPNALLGPSGYGAQHFIQPTGNWSYTVEFENDGGVAAQNVTVAEQLDPNLDWSTFQLGSFGFGPVTVAIPAGLTHYQTTIAYQNVDGTPLNVKVFLDFNVQTGLLTVTFTALDPATGQAPTGVFDGFLPPDNKSEIGEGFVQYSVKPKAGLATGTQIDATAAVVFDNNAPVITNTYRNVINNGPPTSSTVQPLSAGSPGFVIHPTGQQAQAITPAASTSKSIVQAGTGHASMAVSGSNGIDAQDRGTGTESLIWAATSYYEARTASVDWLSLNAIMAESTPTTSSSNRAIDLMTSARLDDTGLPHPMMEFAGDSDDLLRCSPGADWFLVSPCEAGAEEIVRPTPKSRWEIGCGQGD